MKKIFALIFSLVVASTTFAQTVATPKVKINTSAGEIIIELYADKAPKTVTNFLQYVEDKHYDGTIFHRVIDNFMIQGGGYDQRYAEKKPVRPLCTKAAKPCPRAVLATPWALSPWHAPMSHTRPLHNFLSTSKTMHF